MFNLSKFILPFILYAFFTMSGTAGIYSADDHDPLDIMPREIILYDGMTQYAELIYVIRPFDGRRYRIRPGLGCLRAFLDPLENVKMELRGFGNFWVSKKEGYPFLHVTTDYHKTMCKITEINPA